MFNFVATAKADSFHFETPSITHEEADHTEHIAHSSSDKAEDHCADHDCCHQNHVHYYLIFSDSFMPNANSVQYNFPEYQSTLLSLYADIIKPPLV